MPWSCQIIQISHGTPLWFHPLSARAAAACCPLRLGHPLCGPACPSVLGAESGEFCLPSLSITVLCPASKSQNPQNVYHLLPVSLTPCGHDLSCASYHPCPLSHHLNILPIFPFVPMNSIPTSPQKPVCAPPELHAHFPTCTAVTQPFYPMCVFPSTPLPCIHCPQNAHLSPPAPPSASSPPVLYCPHSQSHTYFLSTPFFS